jgi:hypothetical protein
MSSPAHPYTHAGRIDRQGNKEKITENEMIDPGTGDDTVRLVFSASGVCCQTIRSREVRNNMAI